MISVSDPAEPSPRRARSRVTCATYHYPRRSRHDVEALATCAVSVAALPIRPDLLDPRAVLRSVKAWPGSVGASSKVIATASLTAVVEHISCDVRLDAWVGLQKSTLFNERQARPAWWIDDRVGRGAVKSRYEPGVRPSCNRREMTSLAGLSASCHCFAGGKRPTWVFPSQIW